MLEVSQSISTWRSQIYGNGILAILFVGLTPFFGLSLSCLYKTQGYEYVLSFFYALSLGTMISNAFLHLIPKVLGLYEDKHLLKSVSPNPYYHGMPQYFWIFFFIVVFTCMLFFIELLIIASIEMQKKGDRHLEEGYGHSHFLANLNKAHLDIHQLNELSPGKKHFKNSEPSIIAFMMILGGTFHRFAYGFAMGTAFTHGLKIGISTTIAVACHEIPLELCGFAVIISSEFNPRKALLLDIVSYLTSILGFILAVELVSDIENRSWVLAIVCGMFIYNGYRQILHEVKSLMMGYRFRMFVTIFIGCGLGIGIMVITFLIEEKTFFHIEIIPSFHL